jgi:competence protein ComEC
VKRAYPYVRLLPVFLAGWWFGNYAQVLFSEWLICASALLVVLLCFLAYHRFGWLTYRLRWIFGFLGFGAVLLAGVQTGLHARQDKVSACHFWRTADATAWLLHCTEPPRITAAGKRLLVDVIAVKRTSGIVRSEGRLVLYASDSTDLRVNDRIWLLVRPTDLQSRPFPGTFDFAAWLAGHGIFHEARLRPGNFLPVDPDPDPALTVRFRMWRERLLSVYKEAGLHNEAWAVMSALVLGYDDAVESDVMKSFSATGTLHVLSVSGLHVGLVYGAIRLLLGFLDRRTFGKRLQRILSLLFIWIYVLLTGASPAVLRAAAMLSLVLGSQLMGRPAAVWNSLAASVFFLTLWDPTLPADVGFQLSYAAVAGILALYPWLREHGPWKQPLLQRGWEFISVSLAAQWFTFPLGLYYFHQFPNLFLLTNALIIPLSTVAMFAGLGLLFLGPVAGLGPLLGAAVQTYMDGFLSLVRWLGDLPHAQVTGIWINGFQLCCLLLLVLVVYGWVVTGRGRFGLVTMLALVLFSGERIRVRSRQLEETDWSVLPVRASVYLFRNGPTAILVQDSVEAITAGVQEKLRAHFAYRGIHPEDVRVYPLDAEIDPVATEGLLGKRRECLVFGKERLWLAVSGEPVGPGGTVVVRRSAGRYRSAVQEFPDHAVVFDGTMNLSRSDSGRNLHRVTQDGYFLKPVPLQDH